MYINLPTTTGGPCPSNLSVLSRLKTRQGLRQLLYHCPTCNRHFKNHLERERHLLVHGPQRPFACLLCDHAVTKMDALAAHVRKHLFLYVCSVCDGKFVSSQRLKAHLKESHTELDQDEAFTLSINNSFYLMQPEGSIWDNKGREESRLEKKGVEEEMRAGDTGEQTETQGENAEVNEDTTGKEGDLLKGDTVVVSPEVLHKTISLESQETSLPPDENTSAATKTHTSSSPGNANLHDLAVHKYMSSALSVEDAKTPLQSERVNSLQYQRYSGNNCHILSTRHPF